MPQTQRDTEVVTALSCSVRLMSLQQIAGFWWPDCKSPLEVARKRLVTLQSQGLLLKTEVLACALPPILEPVNCWAPGKSQPDLGSIAWQLQSRWNTAPKPVEAFIATRQAAKLFGGKATGRIKRHYQATHDIGVAQMYLRVRETRPALITQWIGEDRLAPYRQQQKLPDAVIAKSPSSTPLLVLEFGGSYDKARVTEFHLDCEQRAVPYEIW